MKVQVIVGSTRQGRASHKLAKWVSVVAEEVEGIDTEIVDLKDFPMPFFNEEISPQYNPNRTPSPEVKKWLDKLSKADGYVIVTPEYNRSFPAVLKNALDYLDYQFAKKPVVLVGHGGTGGAQAVSQLRNVVAAVKGIGMPNAVYFSGRVDELISEEGALEESIKANPYGPEAALVDALDQFKW